MKRARKGIASFFIAIGSLAVVTIGHAIDTGYRSPEHAPGTTTVTVDEAKWLFDDGAVFIDVRNPRFFARRHVPGAYHLDMKDAFTRESLAAVARKDQPIVIYSSGVKCGRAHRASVLAVSWGYEKVHYFRGGIIDWKDVQYPMESGRQ
jgi:rhodanese-related sulfurtransferase